MTSSPRSLRRVIRGIAPLAITAMFSVPLAPLVACSSAESPNAGCTKDTDCTAGRICGDDGRCIAQTGSTSSGGGASASTTASGATTTATGAGGGATTSTGTGMMCDPGNTLCGSACIDITNDANHCGGCDKPCGQESTCKNGSCAPNWVVLKQWNFDDNSDGGWSWPECSGGGCPKLGNGRIELPSNWHILLSPVLGMPANSGWSIEYEATLRLIGAIEFYAGTTWKDPTPTTYSFWTRDLGEFRMKGESGAMSKTPFAFPYVETPTKIQVKYVSEPQLGTLCTYVDGAKVGCSMSGPAVLAQFNLHLAAYGTNFNAGGVDNIVVKYLP